MLGSELFHFFSGGTEYTKDFKIKSDARKCITSKHIGTTQYTNYELSAGGEIDTTFHYKCFERDPWWGKLSAIFIFLPGKCTFFGNTKKLLVWHLLL